MKKIKLKVRQLNQTLVELLIGIIILTILIGLLGIIFSKNPLNFCIGVLIGGGSAAILAISMLLTVEKQLDLPMKEGMNYARRNVVLRFIFMGVIVLCGIRIPVINEIGLVLGLLSLKVSVYIRPIIQKLITKYL